MNELCPCPVINCDPGDQYRIYSLQSETYPFVISCPPGWTCSPPLGDDIYLVCCDDYVVSRFVPADATDAVIHGIQASMLEECELRGECEDDEEDDKTVLYANTPQTCTKYCPDGSPFTYTIPAGRVFAYSRSDADRWALQIACKTANENKICMRCSTTPICVGVAYSSRIVATGLGLNPTPMFNLWTIVSGSLPPGLTFHGGNLSAHYAVIDGTPTTGGTYTFTVRVDSPKGFYQTKTCSISVIQISPTTLATAAVGVPYSEQLIVIGVPSGAIAEFYLESGTITPGLSLADSGLITGTPTAASDYTFNVAVVIIT